MSAKFLTFPYNSRSVWSSYMKFWQQFEITDLHVCTKFWGNRWRDFGFRTRKPLRKFGAKNRLNQKRLKYGKKYFTRLYVVRYLFVPTNPLLAAMRSFSFFSSWTLYALLLNHKISKSNFCVKFLCCKRYFVSLNFFGDFSGNPPKNQFFERF